MLLSGCRRAGPVVGRRRTGGKSSHLLSVLSISKPSYYQYSIVKLSRRLYSHSPNIDNISRTDKTNFNGATNNRTVHGEAEGSIEPPSLQAQFADELQLFKSTMASFATKQPSRGKGKGKNGIQNRINSIRDSLMAKENSIALQAAEETAVVGQYRYRTISASDNGPFEAKIYRENAKSNTDGDVSRSSGVEERLVMDMAAMNRYCGQEQELFSMKPCTSIPRTTSSSSAHLGPSPSIYPSADWIALLTRDISQPSKSRLWIRMMKEQNVCVELDLTKCFDSKKWTVSELEWQSEHRNGTLRFFLLLLNLESDRTDCVIEVLVDTTSPEFTNATRRSLGPASAPSSSNLLLFKYFSVDNAMCRQVMLEENPACHLGLSIGKGKDVVFVHSQTKLDTAVYALRPPLSQTFDEGNRGSDSQMWSVAQLICPRVRGRRNFFDHLDGHFYISSNYYSKTGDLELFRCKSTTALETRCNAESVFFSEKDRVWPASQTDPQAQESSVLVDFDAFRGGSVVYGRTGGLNKVDVIHYSTTAPVIHSATESIAKFVQSNIFEVYPHLNADFSAETIELGVSNPLLPGLKLKLGLKNCDVSVISSAIAKFESKDANVSDEQSNGGIFGLNRLFRSASFTKTVKSDDIRNEFETLRMYCPSSQNEKIQIPITVVLPRCKSETDKVKTNDPLPTLLLGYGAYGNSLSCHYLAEHHELLEMGWAIAFAHVRGGSELGQQWHSSGRLQNKWNTFIDFADCASFLINKGLTTPNRLCAMGSSAGGLIMGVSSLNYGHLFRSILMRSPFLDIYRVMQDPSLPLTIHEYDEWGQISSSSPDKDWDADSYIKSYSPIELLDKKISNLEGGAEPTQLPNVMISVGLQDSRVNPEESLEFISMLRYYNKIAHQFRKNGSKKVDFQSDGVPLSLLRPWSEGGHDGPWDLKGQSQMKAEEIVFLDETVKGS